VIQDFIMSNYILYWCRQWYWTTIGSTVYCNGVDSDSGLP